MTAKACAWIAEQKLERDFAIVECKGNCITMETLRETMKAFEATRWIVFVYGPKRVERIVARSSIRAPEMSNIIAIDKLPEDSQSFFLCPMEPVETDSDETWWSKPPHTAVSMDAYMKEATAFLRDLTSETPLGRVNRCGLWITLRAIASTGDDGLLGDVISRFHAALLYDLRQGAHRFSRHLKSALASSVDCDAGAPGSIGCITYDKPAVTCAMRSMFPTDSCFEALPLEELGLVGPLVASRSLLVQMGWILGPRRLLRPYVLAGRTVALLRRVSESWLAAAAAATPGNGADQPALREMGLQMKRLFRTPPLRDLCHRSSNAMYTSAAAAAHQPKPPRCVREYLMRAEQGDHGAKLHFQTRWGMLRLLRAIQIPRHVMKRAFISTAGMPLWYPNPSCRQSELKQREATLKRVFSVPLNDHKVSCQTFNRYNLCPFRGDVGSCCASQTGQPGQGVGVWSPWQVANLGQPRVTVALDISDSSSGMVENLYVVTKPPARLFHASALQL